MKREAITVSKGKKGTPDFVGVEVLVDDPQTPEEFEAFWKAHLVNPERDRDRLAYQQYVVKAQARGRGKLDAKAADKGKAAVQKAVDDYQYEGNEGGGGTKTRKVAPAKVSKADLRNPKALLERLRAEGLLEVDEEEGSEG